MAATAASSAGKKKGARGRSVPPRRGQVLKRVFASIFSWLPARSMRRHRSPRGRRGNRVPAGGGHVEPEPDVAAARRYYTGSSTAAHHDTTAGATNNNHPPAAADTMIPLATNY